MKKMNKNKTKKMNKNEQKFSNELKNALKKNEK